VNRRTLPLAVVLLALVASGRAAEPQPRTDSGQFTIYCENAGLRRQVASFAVQTRAEVIALLGESDTWKRPIVVNLRLDSPAGRSRTPVTLSMVQSPVGLKYEIMAYLGTEPTDINLQKHLIRAVLLEYMYRRGTPADGSYVEPPWWLVEGAVELLRRRESGVQPRFFRTLIETNKLPPITAFLAQRPDELGPTALAVDRALAMCFVQLLVEQPGGRDRLASLVRAWPESRGDSLAALGKEFPALAGGAPALQKWWTLNLARYAAGDRLLGLAADETTRQIAALLEFDFAEKDGTKQRFAVADFPRFLKLPGAKPALAARQAALVDLSIRANVLLRPVLAEYHECLGLLARGKTRGMEERLARAAELHQLVTRRASDIGDYMNWFEATQMGGRSGAFDSYLKAADEIDEQLKTRTDPVSRYLDQLEREL